VKDGQVISPSRAANLICKHGTLRRPDREPATVQEWNIGRILWRRKCNRKNVTIQTALNLQKARGIASERRNPQWDAVPVPQSHPTPPLSIQVVKLDVHQWPEILYYELFSSHHAKLFCNGLEEMCALDGAAEGVVRNGLDP
jgi:hypothetical protein